MDLVHWAGIGPGAVPARVSEGTHYRDGGARKRD